VTVFLASIPQGWNSTSASGNKFSIYGAFYVTNSVRQVYEHPLYNHPQRNIEDYIVVLEFTVPLRVLYGLMPSPGGGDPFHIKWFEGVEKSGGSFVSFKWV
jgi:hypothetical protein